MLRSLPEVDADKLDPVVRHRVQGLHLFCLQSRRRSAYQYKPAGTKRKAGDTTTGGHQVRYGKVVVMALMNS